jgi:aminoglycoside 3-N-acetyltransferase
MVLRRIVQQLEVFIRKYSPSWTRGSLRNLRRLFRRRQFYADRYVSRETVSRRQITDDLKALGIKQGDVLLVHSSLSRVGFVKGSADTVIDALLDVLGEEGTLVMPAFSFRLGMQDDLESGPPFDVNASPSYMGKITEVFRQRQGVRRSLHPTHSVCALGPKAEHLIKGHETSTTPFGANGPFPKLVELHAKILCLGVTIAYMTSFHTFEDWIDDYPIPVYLNKRYSVPVTDANGRELIVSTRSHDPAYSDLRIEKRPALLALIEDNFRKMGILHQGNVGKAESSLIGAYELNQALGELLAQGITIYDVDMSEFER